MAKLNRAAFSRTDIDDAKRGYPDFDLRDYAARRGLEFLDHGTPARHRAALPGREELQLQPPAPTSSGHPTPSFLT